MLSKELLNDLDNVLQKKNINIIEIGTGNGDNSTKNLYNYFKNKYNLTIISYEGDKIYYENAQKIWKNINNVKIKNEYFVKKEKIKELLIPNIPDYIIDYEETGDRLKKKYQKIYDNININNYITNVDIIPDIVFIDCSRFMHLPIIDLCYDFFKTNPDCIYIMEEDYFINNTYGELDIILKYFELDNVLKYNNYEWQWPFITFQIKNRK
jgi:hypothetical protein